MNGIRFSERWDKLKDTRWTTIRSYEEAKEEYYSRKLCQEFVILLAKGRYPAPAQEALGKAVLMDLEVVVPRNLPRSVIDRDVTLNGVLSTYWWNRVLAMDKALLLTFERVDTTAPEIQPHPEGGVMVMESIPDSPREAECLPTAPEGNP